MSPSSLVFVAIVVLWAAYIVPHWLRRRDQLAQSRGRDRFSSRLRVLTRRQRGLVGGRSGDAVLTPRIIRDADGEPLYIPGSKAVPAAATPLVSAVPAPAAAPAPAVAAAVASARAAKAAPSVTSASAPVGRAPMAAARQAEPLAPAPAAPTASVDRAIAVAGLAARRRARIMLALAVLTAWSWGVTTVPAVPMWVAAPATVFLVLHALASRVAALRSRRAIGAQAAAERRAAAEADRAARKVAAAARPAATPASRPAVALDRPARRAAAAVGAETWVPVPVPPPTYTLKPVVRRPEPAPLEVPAASAPAAARTVAARTVAARTDRGRAVSRGALPRRPEEIERILALEELPHVRPAVNG